MFLNRIINNNLFVLLLLILLGAGIYHNSLHNVFHYDDQLSIEFNKNIRTLENIPYFFTDPGTLKSDPNLSGHYRPLVVTSYAINYEISGLNPVGFRITNLAFHIGTAFLIFLIVRAMLGFTPTLTLPRQGGGEKGEGSGLFPPLAKGGWGDLFAAIAASLIFLAHPFNSEAVNYITALSSVMSGFFYLLGFLCWVKYREVRSAGCGVRKYYVFSILAFIAGMLSKEVVVTLPVMLWLYDVYFLKDLESRKEIPFTSHFTLRTSHYIAYLPFVLVVIIPYFLIRIFTMNKVLDSFQRDMVTQLLTELPVFVKHWQMFLFPTGLSVVHDIDVYKGVTWVLAISIILTIAYLSLAAYLFSIKNLKLRLISFFMFWFFIVLLPTTIIPLNAIFQENRGYLAIVSFAVCAGICLNELKGTGKKRVGAIVLMIITAVYSAIVIQQNKVWGSWLLLWSNTVVNAPESYRSYSGLASAYLELGDLERSESLFKKAVTLGGDNDFLVHANLGKVYMRQKKVELAIAELEKTSSLNPNRSEVHNDLGSLYYRTGRIELSEVHFNVAVRLDPTDYIPFYNLANLYEEKGMVKEAINYYNQALSINPGHVRSHLFIGLLLEDMGNRNDAMEHYNKVVQLGKGKDQELIAEAQKRLKKDLIKLKQ